MTDWLRNVPVYQSLNQAERAMLKAKEEEAGEYELLESDYVLAGLVSYLALNYTPEVFRETVLNILDSYCGKPVKESS